ncbi:hypothetical protein ACFQ0T_17310 [Kitasatospora gansuensis]
MDLYDRLRDLREHARAEREATGLRFSALATEQAVRLSTRPGAAEFTARRINDWAPANRKDARPPSFEDRGCLLALAELWSDWAELPFDEASWAALLPSPPAPLALPWTTNQINDGDFHGTVVMAQTANLGLPEQRRPAPSALAPLRALPPEFTGREAELAALLPLLDPASEAEPVLVTSVAGMGGIGKTTLALAVPRRTGAGLVHRRALHRPARLRRHPGRGHPRPGHPAPRPRGATRADPARRGGPGLAVPVPTRRPRSRAGHRRQRIGP